MNADDEFLDWFIRFRGQIRVKPAMYGGGWIGVAGIAGDTWDDVWDDLTEGYDEYENAKCYFVQEDNYVFAEGVGSSVLAFKYCLDAMQEKYRDLHAASRLDTQSPEVR